jgi:hypothetical protein
VVDEPPGAKMPVAFFTIVRHGGVALLAKREMKKNKKSKRCRLNWRNSYVKLATFKEWCFDSPQTGREAKLWLHES